MHLHPLNQLETAPEEILEALRTLGIATCEEAYEFVLDTSETPPEPNPPLTVEATQQLRAALEDLLPKEALEALRTTRELPWPEEWSLGVIPPPHLESLLEPETSPTEIPVDPGPDTPSESAEAPPSDIDNDAPPS